MYISTTIYAPPFILNILRLNKSTHLFCPLWEKNIKRHMIWFIFCMVCFSRGHEIFLIEGVPLRNKKLYGRIKKWKIALQWQRIYIYIPVWIQPYKHSKYNIKENLRKIFVCTSKNISRVKINPFNTAILLKTRTIFFQNRL